MNPLEKVLFRPILSLEDLLAQGFMRFMSSALRKIYKIRTERLPELGAPRLMKFSWKLFLIFIFFIICIIFLSFNFLLYYCEHVICKIQREEDVHNG